MRQADPSTMIGVAAQLLSDRFEARVRLIVDRILSGNNSNIVIRCRAAGPSSIPSSLIIKALNDPAAGKSCPGRESSIAACELMNDWAASVFLERISSIPRLAPLLYRGDRERRLLIFEDLGDGDAPDTAAALGSSDPDLAQRRLVEHVSLIARLHGLTLGRRDEYLEIRNALGATVAPRPVFTDPWSNARSQPIADQELEQAVTKYKSTVAAVGVAPTAGIEPEIRRVARTVEEHSGPLLAFCKGDQNGAGDYIWRESEPRLFDFGSSGYRHALIEGLPGRLTWGCIMRIPESVVQSMESGYQTELERVCPDVASIDLHRAMVLASGRWHILHVVHRLPEALVKDRERGPTTLRQQVVAWLDAFADLSERLAQLPALGASARYLVQRLRRIWPVYASNLPYYPAFRGSQM
jgi:hypothetical protein